MKSLRECSHAVLMQKILDEGRATFIPPVSFIKKVIDGLVDKSYLAKEGAYPAQEVYKYVL